MLTHERDFATFELGDHVYPLGNWAIPELGGRLGMNISNPDVALGQMVGQLGPNKVLRENGDKVQQVIPIEAAAGLVERSGVAQALNRSLWSSEQAAPEGLTVIATGGMANWQDRTAELLAKNPNVQKVHLALGNRVMDSATEITHPNVKDYLTEHGRYPTEAEYGKHYVRQTLRDAKKDVRTFAYATNDGAQIAAYHLGLPEGEELLDHGFVVARVATAGVQLALQWRKAAQDYNKNFDANPDKPQLGILTDGVGGEANTMQLARTAEELKTPKTHQSPYTALRQLAVTAKLLHEARVSR